LERFPRCWSGSPARRRAPRRSSPAPDEVLATRVSQKWSVKEHLGHLLDLHPLDVRRVGEFLDGAAVLSAADMSNRQTEARDHGATPIAQLLPTLDDARQQLTRMLGMLTEEQIAATARHPRLGVTMRVIDWAQFVADHDDHHLAAARTVLRSLDETRAR
jgi:uncharacterized damage-inducible protein DinB